MLADVPERRMPQIVPQRNCFRQVLVQLETTRQCPGNLRHFQRVRQPRAVVVAFRREEHLRFVFQAAKRFAVDDAVAVALKIRAHRAGDNRLFAAARVLRADRPR